MFDQCLYFNTSALARRLDKEWSDAFAPFGLTPSQAFMLRALLDRPGLLQRELSDALSISRSTATRALDHLEAKGHVERHKAGSDGREVALFPTPQAMKIKAALNEASGAVTARLKKVLGAQHFTNTVSQIKGVRSALE
jgi:MarR family transcriptional regulator, temperature-dependent positive regulator of motility